MTTKRALIVDDSKTALVRLRKMLERFDLQIDTALSAEEALSYLSYRTPAVVFMDHMMPGLDGFEALKIIKSNPNTAMIPIVMYTSKSGDLYVGQARALGAIDVLSKDGIQPSTLENVLRVIGIIRPDKQTAEPEPAPAAEEKPPVPTERLPASPPPEASGELQVIRRQVARMLEINIAKVRHEISSQSRLLYKRLNRDIKELRERRDPPPSVEPAPPSPPSPPPEPPPEPVRKSSRLPLWLILIVLCVLGYQLIGVRGVMDENAARTRDIESKLDRGLAAADRAASADRADPFASIEPLNLLAALQWGLNRDNRFEFGSQALGGDRLVMLQELVSRLDEAGFSGGIELLVHLGDFCVVHGESGDWVLPDGETPAQQCRRLSDQADAASLQDQMSVAFINYLVSSPVLNGGRIRVDVRNGGFAEPRFRYPEPTVEAGQWNRTAALNNRVEIRLQPSRGDRP